MKMGRSLVLGIAGSVMISSGAMAADVPPPPVAAAPPPPPMAAPAFDWGGLYVGLLGSTFVQSFDEPLGAIIGGFAGYNLVMGNFLVGVRGGLLTGIGEFAGGPPGYQLHGRAGVLLGDKLLAYGFIGISGTIDLDSLQGSYGGGLELALGEGWSVFTSLGQFRSFDCTAYCVSPLFGTIGFHWHPGN